MERLAGKRALVMGLGVNQGGVGVARYLSERGAEVRVTDLSQEDQLADSLAALADLPIAFTLGRHDEADFAWADIVVRNPAVRRESHWLEVARTYGATIEMEMTLFFRASRAQIIGVTGTKGKTSTAMMIAELLRNEWPDVRIAGNMGRSAVQELHELEPDVPVVLEVSSFQIEGLIEQRLSPHIAVITNIAEDHLDRYESFTEYARIKTDFGRFQGRDDWLVIPADDDLIQQRTDGFPGRRATFALDDPGGANAFWMDAGRFVGRRDGEVIEFGSTADLRLPGQHSRRNALAAIAAATLAGVPAPAIASGIGEISGIADRLEPVASIDGVTYINDTTATVPVAAIAALQSFGDSQVVAIAGGSEKHVALDAFADELAARAAAVVLLEGDATPELKRLLHARSYQAVHGPYGSMDSAVNAAACVATAGSVVLLSPGCASFGVFRNEFDRGRQFRRAVGELSQRRDEEAG